MTIETPAEAIVLHQCGENIELGLPTELAGSDGYRSSLGVWVEQEPAGSPLAGRITVALGHYDGDTSYANMWENLTPNSADALAQALIHHAGIARRYAANGELWQRFHCLQPHCEARLLLPGPDHHARASARGHGWSVGSDDVGSEAVCPLHRADMGRN